MQTHRESMPGNVLEAHSAVGSGALEQVGKRKLPVPSSGMHEESRKVLEK